MSQELLQFKLNRKAMKRNLLHREEKVRMEKYRLDKGLERRTVCFLGALLPSEPNPSRVPTRCRPVVIFPS